MLKKLADGGVKLGCKALVDIYVRMVMTLVYAVATLVGGAKAVGVVRKNKKVVHWSILGVTIGSILISVFFGLKDVYETCQLTGYAWVGNRIMGYGVLPLIIFGLLAYFILNLVKAYHNRLEDTTNALLISM